VPGNARPLGRKFGRKSPKTIWIPKQLNLNLVHSAPHLIYLPALFILLFSHMPHLFLNTD